MRPFEHHDAAQKSDDALADEAQRELAGSPARQFVAELLERLRADEPSWWSPALLREKWPAAERMKWLGARADLRQRITSALTGLAPRAARKKAPEFQAGLIDAVVDEGDASVRDFDRAFAATELAVYGPADAFFGAVVELLPLDAGPAESAPFTAWLLDALLAGVSPLPGAFRRSPILTPLDVRQSIDAAVWHTKVPLDVRVAIDAARLAHERERRDAHFGAAEELSLATPEVLAACLTIRDLAPVLAAASRALGFASSDAAPAAVASVRPKAPAHVASVAPPAHPAHSSPPAHHASSPPVAQPSASRVSRPAPAPVLSPSQAPPPVPATPRPVIASASVALPPSAPPPPLVPDVPAPPSVSPRSARSGPPTTPPGMLPAPPPMHGRASTPPLPPPPAHPAAAASQAPNAGAVGPSGTLPPPAPSSPTSVSSPPSSPSRRAPPPPPPRPAEASKSADDSFDEVQESDLESTNPWDEEGEPPPGLVSRGRPLRRR